jgi:RNA polymerase sigma-70 factor (ECF subfamily)
MKRKGASVLHLDDKRQVKILLSGDQEAFRQFFDDNYARLYRFALPRLGNDSQAAEELVVQGLSKALMNLESYRGEAQLFTWLCTIVRNEITDWQRKQNRMSDRIVLTEDFPGIKAAVESFHAPACDEPSRRLERAETTRLIKVALDRLPPTYGNVLEWKYIEGYSAQEIADRLNLGLEATNSLLARAKRAFVDVFGALTDRPTEPAH